MTPDNPNPPESSNQAPNPGEERTPGKRRNRRRGKKRPTEAPPAQTAPAAATVRPDVKPVPAPKQEPRPKRQPPPAPKPPQERAPRGSVLQRRSSRPEPSFMKEQDAAPEKPTAPITANSVEEYVKHLHGWQREVVMALRSIVKATTPDASEGILWSQPVYSLKGPVVYIKAFSDHVNLGFWRGNEIDDPENLLSGELPTMRHVTLRHVNDIKREAFERMIRQAFKMDKEKGDATA